MDQGGVRERALRMLHGGGRGGEPEHSSFAGTANAIVFLFFVFPLTWISAGTVLVSEQMVAFLPRLEVFDSLLKELLWRQSQITVALEATLSSPVCPPGSRHRSILKHRLSNFCSLCILLCLLPDLDTAALTPGAERAHSGAIRPLLKAALPPAPIHRPFVRPASPINCARQPLLGLPAEQDRPFSLPSSRRRRNRTKGSV